MIKENIEYIESLKRFGIKEGLTQIKSLCNTLDNPQNSYPTIHIAGTNGKGSTSTLIAKMLELAGYRVGLYTSPYIHNFNERIQINSMSISDNQLDILITNLRNKIDNQNLEATFFELITAITFQHFKNENVDIAVIETGLGGKLDSTNIINSKLSVITNIGLDHCDYLGKTKKEITLKKAGIIKSNQTFITSEKEIGLIEILKQTCKENNTKFINANDKIQATKISNNLDQQIFSTFGLLNETLTTPLLGDHQIQNILTAITTIKNLEGYSISDEDIKKAINETIIPGRIQIISKKPLIILDAAHNPEGIQSIANFIKPLKNKSTLVIGMTQDKKHDEMLEPLASQFQKVITTEGNYKPTKATHLADKVRKYNGNVVPIKEISHAIEQALIRSKKEDTILITGSMYMVSDALNYLSKSTLDSPLEKIKGRVI